MSSALLEAESHQYGRMGKGDEKMLERGKMDRDLVEFVVIDQLVPKEHLLRKIDAAVDFTRLYEMVEPLYCEDNGRPSIDPVVLFKMVLIQHLYGLPSLRRTAEEVSANNCYRWFLGYPLQEETPHFSTVSYNFRHRFTEETVDRVFAWILDEVAKAGYLAMNVGIGLYFNKKSKQNTSSYLVADRQIGLSFLVATFLASDIGGDALTGSTGNAFANGIVEIPKRVVVVAIWIILSTCLAKKLNKFGSVGALTAAEILGKTYGRGAQFLGGLSSMLQSSPSALVMRKSL